MQNQIRQTKSNHSQQIDDAEKKESAKIIIEIEREWYTNELCREKKKKIATYIKYIITHIEGK